MTLALNDPFVKTGLHTEHELVSLILFGLMGLINGSALGVLLCYGRRNKINERKRRSKKQRQTRLNKLLESDWLIVGAEIIEIPLQSFQCYLIHEHSMSQTYSLIFTLVLVLNCWMVAYPNISIKQCLLIDIVLDLAFVLLPFTCLGMPLVVEYVNDPSLMSKFEFNSFSTNVVRSMVITSGMDLCSKASPILLGTIQLFIITHDWQNPKKYKTTISKPQSVERHPVFLWIRRWMILWGFLVVGISIQAHGGTRCDTSTCLYQTHPWFMDHHQCVCKVRVYSCRGDQSSIQFYDLKELEQDVELTGLKIDGCSQIETLPSKAINKMVHMEGMQLTHLNLSKFEVEVSNMPGLLYLSLVSNPLGQIPPVLYSHKLPPLFLSLVISNTSISMLPDQALHQWKDQIVTLYVDHNSLENFPIGLVNFRKLRNLRLSRTGITSLPRNFTLLESLTYLEMSSCGLKTLPLLNQLPKLNELNLANNSLTEPPVLGHPELFQMIEWSLNPFCEVEEYAHTSACRTTQCSPDCSRLSMKGYACHPGCSRSNHCNHPSCR